MWRANSTTSRLITFGCIGLLIILIVLIVNPMGISKPQKIAEVPQVGGVLPGPQSTVEFPTPGLTPTRPIPTTTPGPAVMQPATVVVPLSVTEVLSDVVDLNTSVSTTSNSTEPIHAISWSPLGDKLLYVTSSGALYSANENGTDATLLRIFDSNLIWFMLDPQQPMTNSLILPGYVARFVLGQQPVLQEAPATSSLTQIRWWSSNRATGITGGPLVGGYVGGEKLITVDADGLLIEERNIPYILSGSIKPGGTWLAYATDQQSTSTPFEGSLPETVYLLNLTTGQRLRVTDGGAGYGVGNWSPNGNWFYMVTRVGSDRRGVLVSADGRNRVVVTPPGYSGADAVFSPDSRRLAFSLQKGGCDAEDSGPCQLTSDVYIVDVPTNTITTFDEKESSALDVVGSNMVMHPKWSPDGSKLTLLSFDPACSGLCSSTSPAFRTVQLKK